MNTFFSFQPLLKRTLWGGTDIVRLKRFNDAPFKIGESWEVSGLQGEPTLVVGGPDDGKTLAQLVSEYGAAFVGRDNLAKYGTDFPLLVKLISAEQDLSVQVHPNDDMAHAMGHAYGKNEMWYVLRADEGASVVSGFRAPTSLAEFDAALADGRMQDLLNIIYTRAGDLFYIPAGRIHSISRGNFIVEIQQSSNDTFRVYDYDRHDDLGRPRELHLAEARQALNFADAACAPITYDVPANAAADVLQTPCFSVRLVAAAQPLALDLSALDSFVIFVGVGGEARLVSGDEEVEISVGKTVLLPALAQNLQVIPKTPDFKMLETFI